MIDFRCSKCGEPMSVPDSLGGELETCPRCRNEVAVPIIWTKADAELLTEATHAYANADMIYKGQFTDEEREQRRKAMLHILAKREWAKMHGTCEPGSLELDQDIQDESSDEEVDEVVTVSMTSENVISKIIENYDEFALQEISKVENELSSAGYNELARLMYTLSVSHCIPSVRTFKSLASRWRSCHVGMASWGPSFSSQFPDYTEVYHFLAERYLSRFMQLSEAEIQKALVLSNKRRSEQAKANVWLRTAERINKGACTFAYELPGLKDTLNIYLSICKQKGITSITG